MISAGHQRFLDFAVKQNAVLTNSARLSFNRHLFCSARAVILYDLDVKGYHTPLTREQIAELYHAGRMDRQ